MQVCVHLYPIRPVALLSALVLRREGVSLFRGRDILVIGEGVVGDFIFEIGCNFLIFPKSSVLNTQKFIFSVIFSSNRFGVGGRYCKRYCRGNCSVGDYNCIANLKSEGVLLSPIRNTGSRHHGSKFSTYSDTVASLRSLVLATLG